MSINTITAVRVSEKGMDYDTFKYSRSWVTEVYGDTIHMYRMESGSRKRLKEAKIQVVPQIITEFLKSLYDFVRTAEHTDIYIDGCEHRITLYYGPHHKEVFEEVPIKGSKSLIDLIEDFVNRNGGQSHDD